MKTYTLVALICLSLSTSSIFGQTISVGSTMGGGIVFYVDKKGQHGLIASTSDQGRGNWW